MRTQNSERKMQKEELIGKLLFTEVKPSPAEKVAQR